MISEANPGEGAGGLKSGKWTDGKLKPKKNKDPEPWHDSVMERLASLNIPALPTSGFSKVVREAMMTLRGGNVLVVYAQRFNDAGMTRVHMWAAAGDISVLTEGTKGNG